MIRLNRRQERFCRNFVDLANATMAARAAGYKPCSARNAGYRLLQQERIAARINEIQVQMADRHCREADALVGKLETVFRRAIDTHQFSAAARAVELQSKLAGQTKSAPTAAGASPSRHSSKKSAKLPGADDDASAPSA